MDDLITRMIDFYSDYFYHGPKVSWAVVMAPAHSQSLIHQRNDQTRTITFAMVCNCSRTLWKNIRHLDGWDISVKSVSSDSNDSRREQTCLQDLLSDCISNMNYLGICLF